MNAKRLHLVNKLQEAAIEAAMRKIWQRERANGETELSFSEWLYSGKNEGCENIRMLLATYIAAGTMFIFYGLNHMFINH